MTDQQRNQRDGENTGYKIGILGGDARQWEMIRGFPPEYECAVWGLSPVSNDGFPFVVRCADWESAVGEARAVILPLPCTRDGTTVHLPHEITGTPIRLTEIVDRMNRGSLLLGGLLPSFLKRYGGEHGIKCGDYYDSEELQILNAVPTAEGAIAACMSELPVTVSGMTAVVLGYGRLGRTLAMRLKALGASVYAVARSERDRAWARCDGCIPIPLEEFRTSPILSDALFNTVPHRILDGEVLSRLGTDTVLFELAGGCCDPKEAQRHGIRMLLLPSLPGKVAPVTAGRIIGAAVNRLLEAELQLPPSGIH